MQARLKAGSSGSTAPPSNAHIIVHSCMPMQRHLICALAEHTPRDPFFLSYSKSKHIHGQASRFAPVRGAVFVSAPRNAFSVFAVLHLMGILGYTRGMLRIDETIEIGRRGACVEGVYDVVVAATEHNDAAEGCCATVLRVARTFVFSCCCGRGFVCVRCPCVSVCIQKLLIYIVVTNQY